MKPPTRIASSLSALGPLQRAAARGAASAAAIHSNASRPANVVPVYGTGPPPEPPAPSAASLDPRVVRRRKQAEMLRQAKDIRAAAGAGRGAGRDAGLLKRRFWRDVRVNKVDGAYEVHLDDRPLRHPTTKQIIRLPLTKPQLAHALAVEWDHLTSAQQATKQHLIPLTSLVCRALDIAADDERGGGGGVRAAVADTLLRYLDTDTLLCLAPPAGEEEGAEGEGPSLRAEQERVLAGVAGFLSARVWPGVRLRAVLDGESLVPRGQEPGVREVVQGWVAGLPAWELAGLERATLAGKGLLGAARLVAEWSEAGLRGEAVAGAAGEEGERFGVEEAARAASVEVDWQIRRWGEVEDSHDVEKVDIRRHLGSVVLLVTGTGSAKSGL